MMKAIRKKAGKGRKKERQKVIRETKKIIRKYIPLQGGVTSDYLVHFLPFVIQKVLRKKLWSIYPEARPAC